MVDHFEKPSTVAPFGRRKVRPRVLVSDAKKPVRTFLVEALEKLGFITCECARACELNAVFDVQVTDLVVIGSSAGAIETSEILNLLAIRKFDGKVLLLGPQDSLVMANVHKFGEEHGLVMLPILATPFSNENLQDSVATLLHSEAPPNPPVDVAEALGADWLELWYQPKVDARTLSLGGAEAHVRMRHPTWGIVSPAYFIPDDSDPYYHALSEFIISRAIEDWHSFVVQHGHIEIAINLPVSFLQDPEIVRTLCLQVPDHPAFEGLIIKINGTDAILNLRLVKDVARQLRFHKIALSIDGVGDEWPSLMGIEEFPFVEIKADKKFVSGGADDRLKQVVCHRILELADDYGSRTVAEGIDSRADFLAVREMGFDRVQGFLFGKPTAVKSLRGPCWASLCPYRSDMRLPGARPF